MQRFKGYVTWKDFEMGVFKIVDPAGLAEIWGRIKNHPKMNYDKMSRALRHYYKAGKLQKVPKQRQCYQFVNNLIVFQEAYKLCKVKLEASDYAFN